MPTYTLYPILDGFVERTTPGTWLAIRDGIGTGSQYNVDGSDQDDSPVCIATVERDWVRINRGIYVFDLSSVAGSVISAVFSLYGHNLTSPEDVFGDEVAVVESSPASDEALVPSDYQALGTTQLSSNIAHSAWNTAGYNDFSLNATGLALVVPGQKLRLGVRSEFDRSDISPVYIEFSESRAEAYYSEQAGTNNDPKLVIVTTGNRRRRQIICGSNA